MHPTPKDAVNLWTAGFATSAVIQGLGLRWFARMAKWGYNDGWQREIAIWNIGTLTLIAPLRRGDAEAPASDDEQARCSRRFLLGETSSLPRDARQATPAVSDMSPTHFPAAKRHDTRRLQITGGPSSPATWPPCGWRRSSCPT
jgi:hypothetical protein